VHVVQDPILALAASDQGRGRLVPTPSTRLGPCATRRAFETHPGALQL
jgi:hypothetical protein